ncbi:MAG: hypothetical protein OXL96_28410 [Candidatus Poribacteria bacterium]|nr:hypothetical protein [Candidatus Poribacteria bacterium]
MFTQQKDQPETIRLAQEVGQIQGALPNLATKDHVSNAALRTTLWVIGVVITLGIAILGAQAGIWLHILSRLP